MDKFVKKILTRMRTLQANVSKDAAIFYVDGALETFLACWNDLGKTRTVPEEPDLPEPPGDPVPDSCSGFGDFGEGFRVVGSRVYWLERGGDDMPYVVDGTITSDEKRPVIAVRVEESEEEDESVVTYFRARTKHRAYYADGVKVSLDDLPPGLVAALDALAAGTLGEEERTDGS